MYPTLNLEEQPRNRKGVVMRDSVKVDEYKSQPNYLLAGFILEYK